VDVAIGSWGWIDARLRPNRERRDHARFCQADHVGFRRERIGMAGIERRLISKDQFAGAAGVWQLAVIVPDYALIARRTLQPMEEGLVGK